MTARVKKEISQTGFYITQGSGRRLPNHMKEMIRLPIAGVHYLFARANHKLEAKPFSYQDHTGLIYLAEITCNKEDMGILVLQNATPRDTNFAHDPAYLHLEFIADATKEAFQENCSNVLPEYQIDRTVYSRDVLLIQGDVGSNDLRSITEFKNFSDKLCETVKRKQNISLSFSALL